MRASRRSQPYRRGIGRGPSAPLAAMKRGKTLYGRHPGDIGRLASKRARKRRKRLA